ncbi:hypothetical protein T484DRAFT_1939970 [Baffinella frigidus]|nr:hypothetical protein T484DRAFT_1939970 [Cryptophyta sp. CCMP2293]
MPGSRVQYFGSRLHCFGIRVECFGIRGRPYPGWQLRPPVCSGFRVSGLGLSVSGLEFRVQCVES